MVRNRQGARAIAGRLLLFGLVFGLFAGTAPSGGRASEAKKPEESPILVEVERSPGPAAADLGEEATGRFREPKAQSLPARSSARGDSSASAAITRTIDAIRRTKAPPGEVFALVSVTDRNSGERRYLSRGRPDLDMALALDDPALEPPGISYEEGEEAWADREVEVVVRSVIAHAVEPPAAGAPDRFEEEERELLERNRGHGVSHRLESGLRERIQRGEIDLAGDALVPVVIDMREVPGLRLPKPVDDAPAGLLYVGLDIAAERQRALIDRKQTMRDRQAPLVGEIEALGGTIRYASWMSGTVRATVPASAITDLTRRGDVLAIEFDEPLAALTHAYVGNDYHVATDAQDFNPYHAGQHGVTSKHSYTSRVVLALGEECIDETSPAWLTAGGSWSRGSFFDCDPPGPCTQGGLEDCSASKSHGNAVAQLLVGDFMDKQDPGLTGPLASFRSRARTGACEECRFIFYQDQGPVVDRSKVHSTACDHGVDLFESSVGSATLSCDGNGPWDSDIEAMANCDVTYVQSAGNAGSASCTTAPPADHPWTFTVGGMQSDDGCDTSGEYYTATCPYDPSATGGGGTYSVTGIATVIDQAAPYTFHNIIVPLSRNPTQLAAAAEGTSLSAPIVAGLMGRLMDWYRVHISTSIFYEIRMRNFMLLMGDRSAFSAGTSLHLNAHDTRWGSGRVGLVPFDDRPVWSIRRASRTLMPFETWVLTDTAVGPASTFYKAVTWQNGTDYQDEPMTRLVLNPTGCSTPTLAVNRLDNKTMLVFSGPDSLTGCDDMAISIEYIPVGFSSARKFHFAAYSDTQGERDF